MAWTDAALPVVAATLLLADRAGIACAARVADADGLAACCDEAGYPAAPH